MCPSKLDSQHIYLTVGGNKLDYYFDPSSPEIILIDSKINLKSVVSDAHKGPRYMGIDIRNYHLNNPMSQFQYMQIHIKDLPQELIDAYNLHNIMDEHGYVHVEIRKGVYVLKEVDIIAYKLLVKNLKPHGYITV